MKRTLDLLNQDGPTPQKPRLLLVLEPLCTHPPFSQKNTAFIPTEIWELILTKLAFIQPIKPSIRTVLLIGLVCKTWFHFSFKIFQNYFEDFKDLHASIFTKFRSTPSLHLTNPNIPLTLLSSFNHLTNLQISDPGKDINVLNSLKNINELVIFSIASKKNPKILNLNFFENLVSLQSGIHFFSLFLFYFLFVLFHFSFLFLFFFFSPLFSPFLLFFLLRVRKIQKY